MGLGLGLGDPPADYGSIAAVGLFVALMCVCIIVGHLLEENRWMNESITALFIGLGTGAVILMVSSGKHSRVLVFSEDLFFIYLLPPIIFNAGFQVKKKQFFRNFMTITLFGAVGTLISFTIISLGALGLISRLNIGALDLGDYLALGAIFSATDSVCTLQVLNQDETPFLYSLVFGEGVVNDATSVVLFNAIQNFDLANFSSIKFLQFIGSFLYLFSTSTLLGVAAGLLSAYVIKKLYFGRHSTDREVSIMMLMAYLSYMLAELLDLSGILTVFFCGIVMSHYTWHNVTESSRVTTNGFATDSIIKILRGEKIGTLFHNEANLWDCSKEVTAREMAVAARDCSRHLQNLSSEERKKILLDIANALEANEDLIISENEADLAVAQDAGYEKSLIARMTIKPGKITSLARSIREIADMEDPIAHTLKRTEMFVELLIVMWWQSVDL